MSGSTPLEFVQYPARLLLRKFQAKGPKYFLPVRETRLPHRVRMHSAIGQGIAFRETLNRGHRPSYQDTSPLQLINRLLHTDYSSVSRKKKRQTCRM